ncbi:MAG: pseudouridine-5'-phosphate glycosidase [Planctomycetota bacterium]
MHQLISRAEPNAVALETTLLLHGVPKAAAPGLAADLAADVRQAGGSPALVGVINGAPTVGINADELQTLLDAGDVAKANTGNLGVLLHRCAHAATTVSTTMELAAGAGVRIFATGGLGGVHKDYGAQLDISADLAAFARFPVAVVTAGVKSLLDIQATREALETLGVPVVGYQTDDFPAFYRRSTDTSPRVGVDARFDDTAELASYVAAELARTGRGVVIANPIPPEHELDQGHLALWLQAAEARATEAGATGRGVTPAILSALHEVSAGKTLEANIALVRANARLAGTLAQRLSDLCEDPA